MKHIDNSTIIQIIFMSIIYFFSGIISLSIFHEHTLITMSAFFPEGFALAGALLFGKRVLPGIFIGQLTLAIYNDFPLLIGSGIALNNMIEAYIALIIFKYFRLNTNLHTLKDLFGLLLLIILLLQPLSAFIGNFFLYMGDMISFKELPESTFFWWIGNVLGQMLITPMILLLYHNRTQLRLRSILLVIFTTILFNYFFQIILEIQNTSLLLILTLPATIYLSTVTISYASISSVLLASSSLYFAQKDIGSFNHSHSMIDNLLNLNYFMISHVILVLLVGILFKEKQKAIQQLQYLAHYDSLTGLPNRYVLKEELHHTVYRAESHQEQSAICFLDIDGFKTVNDTLGHAIGDEVLKEVAERIKPQLNQEDILIRLGGDEFLIIMNNIKSKMLIPERLDKILSTVSDTIRIQEHKINISVSIGVALCPDNSLNMESLINLSDKAMYEAKEKGKNRFIFA